MRARLILIVVPLLAIALLFVFRPPEVRILAPSPSPTTSASATTDLSAVPSECRGDVKGAAFASGSLDDRIRAANAWGTSRGAGVAGSCGDRLSARHRAPWIRMMRSRGSDAYRHGEAVPSDR